MTIIKQCGDILHDEDVYMKDQFYTFKRLLFSYSVFAPFFGNVVSTTAQVEASFLLGFGAFTVRPVWGYVLCALGALAVVVYWLTAMVVLLVGMKRAKLQKRVHRRAMIFYLWWPALNFVLCLVAIVAGCVYGDYQWYTNLGPYTELETLQPYTDVNPSVVSGGQFLDAGTVGFSDGVVIDRTTTGCMVANGHTYCVAPIVYAGSELDRLVGTSQALRFYDFFAVGVDCCSCDYQDFRCGEWRNPRANGGMRSLDYKSRPFYRLAVDDWSATYSKQAKTPLFFDWVQSPEYRWARMWRQFMYGAALGCLIPIPVAFGLAMVAAHLLRSLMESAVASPLDAPKPPHGLEGLWALFFPDMVRQYAEERKQLMALPIQPPPDYGAMLAPQPAKPSPPMSAD